MIRHPRAVLYEVGERRAIVVDARQVLADRLADLHTHRPTYIVQPLRSLLERTVMAMDAVLDDFDTTAADLRTRGWDRTLDDREAHDATAA